MNFSKLLGVLSFSGLFFLTSCGGEEQILYDLEDLNSSSVMLASGVESGQDVKNVKISNDKDDISTYLTKGYRVKYENNNYTVLRKDEGTDLSLMVYSKDKVDLITEKMVTYPGIETLDLSSTSNSTSILSSNGKFEKSPFMVLTTLRSINLQYLELGGATSLEGLFEQFFDNSSLDTVDMTGANVSNVTSMARMFRKTPIKNLIGLDTSHVTDMSYMFQHSKCPNLTLDDKFNTSSVTDMTGMFSYSRASKVDFSTFDTSSVTSMKNMFEYSNFTSLDLTSFNTANVTDMSGMFTRAKATAIDVSSFDTSNVTDMSRMFHATEAEELNLANFNTANVTTMRGMFASAQAKTLDLSFFDTSNVTDMSLMFSSSLATSIDLSSFDTSAATTFKGMFRGSALPSIDLSTFTTTAALDMSYMFADSKATSLTLSSFDTSTVTDMSYMFKNSKVTELDLSNFNTASVTNMSYMFADAVDVLTLDLSNFSFAALDNANSMFYNTAHLKERTFNAITITSPLDLSNVRKPKNAEEIAKYGENALLMDSVSVPGRVIDVTNFATGAVDKIISKFKFPVPVLK